jgi:uncharacterized protein YjbI with pentapeptide repeats
MNLLELLEAGRVEEFNATRGQRSAPDLFAVDLSGKDLRGVDFSGANLEKADLSGADLRGSVLARANFSGADLTGARLDDVVAIKSRWTEAWLEKAGLGKADLTGSDMVGAVLNQADACGAVFRGVRLKNAELHEAKLANADFREVKASGADFTGADLSEADFVDARFKGADFTGAKLAGANFSGAQGAGVIMTNADMRGVCMARANLTEANFGGAQLQGADLTRADLASAAFVGADLEGTNLHEARLDDAEISPEQLKQALRDDASCGEQPAPTELCIGDVLAAIHGDHVAVLWENDAPSDSLSLCVSVFTARQKKARKIKVLPVPAELILARGLVSVSAGFVVVTLVERPSGVVIGFTEVGLDGELGTNSVHALEYNLAVSPVVVASESAVLVYGLSRRGPGLFVHRYENGTMERVHAEEAPTARGFVGSHPPVVVTKGGLLMPATEEGLSDPVSSPGSFPGRCAVAVKLANGLGLAWLETEQSGIQWSLGEEATLRTGCVDHEVEVSSMDLLSIEDGPHGSEMLVAYTRESDGEMSPMGVWGCRLPGGAPFKILVDSKVDVDHVQFVSGGEVPTLLCQTLDEELVVITVQGEAGKTQVRFP